VSNDDEALSSLHPMSPEEKATLQPMTDERFIAATLFTRTATVEQFIKALDLADYWGNESLPVGDKRQHVQFKLDNLREPAKHRTEDMVKWLEETFPGFDFLGNVIKGVPLPDDVSLKITQKAFGEKWHPDQVIDAMLLSNSDVTDPSESVS
jgi:hypothetical protein